MSLNREAALKNAILRTTRFDNIFQNYQNTDNTIFKILILGDGYYKIFISHNNGSSMIEIMDKEIISIKAAGEGEEYSIQESGAFIISGIDLVNVSISIEYYTSFEFVVEPGQHASNKVTSVSDTLTYIKDVHANNIRVNNLNVSNVQTPLLECNEIRLGDWRFYLDRDGSDNLVTIGQITADQTGG